MTTITGHAVRLASLDGRATITGSDPSVQPDERDLQLLAGYVTEYNAREQSFSGGVPFDRVQVGDWVRFADGVERRVSYVWRDELDLDLPNGVQTSAGGSFHIGPYGASFSGSLFTGVDASTLTLTGERQPGTVWFFHHEHQCAHNGVHGMIPFRVWECSLASEATR